MTPDGPAAGSPGAPTLVVMGAGGHARVVLDALRRMGGLHLLGLLDADPRRQGSLVDGLPVLGGDALLDALWDRGVRHLAMGVGSVGGNPRRRELFASLQGRGFSWVSIVDPRALLSPAARLGQGVTVFAGAIVNAGAELGDDSIVNSGAIVEHDCRLGAHAHVAPGACLGGGVVVGAAAHVGIGAVVREGLRLGDGCLVGAGAVVVRDVPSGATVVGCPARELQRRRAQDGEQADG